jgi:LmeA-like phospholipid-binding
VRAILVILVVLAVVLLIVPRFVLPPVLEGLVARKVQEQLGLAERPAVDLDSDPRSGLLPGGFSGGDISVGETDLGGVRAEGATMDLDPFSLDLRESVRSRTLVTEEPISGRVELTLSEEEVSRLAEQNARVPINDVELKRSGVTVESEAWVLGFTLPVTVDGGVGVEGDALVFQPEEVRAAGVAVPADVADSLLAGTAFRYPVEDLPYGGRLTGAETVDGAVVLAGRVSGVDLRG